MRKLLLLIVGLLVATLSLGLVLSGKGQVDKFATGDLPTCDATTVQLHGWRVYDIDDNVEKTCSESAAGWVTSGGTGGTSTLDFLTTGTIRGNVHVVTTVGGTDTPTADEMRGTFHVADHATATSNVDYTLPDIDDVGLGASACFYDNGGGGGGIILDPSDSDIIMYEGVPDTAGHQLESPGVAGAGANGDYICLLVIDETTPAGIWATTGRSGVWIQGS